MDRGEVSDAAASLLGKHLGAPQDWSFEGVADQSLLVEAAGSHWIQGNRPLRVLSRESRGCGVGACRDQASAALLFASNTTLDITFEPTPLYDNGPLVTHPGAGAGGADVSMLQSTGTNHSWYGFNANQGAGLALADDFVVCDQAGWTIDSIEVFAHQQFAPTAPSTMTGLYLEIWDGQPDLGGEMPVAGSPGITNELLASGEIANEWTGIYRTAGNDIATATDIPIMRVRAALPEPVFLPPGRYWLQWSLSGSGTGYGPATVPITVLDQVVTGNSRKFNGSSWGALASNVIPVVSYQGLPFRLYGTRADAPGSIEYTTTSCGGLDLTVSGPPVIGGFIRAKMTNRDPSNLPFLGLSLASSPQTLCGCQLNNINVIALFGTTYQIGFPPDPAYCGLELFIQGIELNAGACPLARATPTAKVTVR